MSAHRWVALGSTPMTTAQAKEWAGLPGRDIADTPLKVHFPVMVCVVCGESYEAALPDCLGDLEGDAPNEHIWQAYLTAASTEEQAAAWAAEGTDFEPGYPQVVAVLCLLCGESADDAPEECEERALFAGSSSPDGREDLSMEIPSVDGMPTNETDRRSPKGKDEREAVRESFAFLHKELDAFIEDAKPTDEDLHFARFRRLDREAITRLTRLAHHGRTAVLGFDPYFQEYDLYEDGTFWYDLFLTISITALSYQEASSEPIEPSAFDTLVITLVLISEYATRRYGDITKRNEEALGNILWATQDDGLKQSARWRAKGMGTAVEAFVETTIKKVENTPPLTS